MLIDTHCHLGDQQFAADRSAVIERAREAGVEQFIVVADSMESATIVLDIARANGVACTAGVHPHVATSWNDDTAPRLKELLKNPEVVAVGEAGLDYHYDYSPRDVQRRVFETQLDMAADLGCPVVVHSRDADDDMVAMIRSTTARLVLHSFSSGRGVFGAAIEGGHYVSFSGMVTFRSWKDEAAVRDVPPDRIMVETDSPYLAPVPHRGKRNEPAFVAEVARRVAELRGIPTDELIRITTENAVRCFGDRLTSTN